MAIRFNCPYCTFTIQVVDNAVGQTGTCPQCGTMILVPIPMNLQPQQRAPLQQPTFIPTLTATNFAPPPAPMFATQPAPKHGSSSTNTNVLILVIVALVIGVGFMVYSANQNESHRESLRNADEDIRKLNRILREIN